MSRKRVVRIDDPAAGATVDAKHGDVTDDDAFHLFFLHASEVPVVTRRRDGGGSIFRGGVGRGDGVEGFGGGSWVVYRRGGGVLGRFVRSHHV